MKRRGSSGMSLMSAMAAPLRASRGMYSREHFDDLVRFWKETPVDVLKDYFDMSDEEFEKKYHDVLAKEGEVAESDA